MCLHIGADLLCSSRAGSDLGLIISDTCHPAPCYLNSKKLFIILSGQYRSPEWDLNLGPKCLSLLKFETWRLRPLGHHGRLRPTFVNNNFLPGQQRVLAEEPDKIWPDTWEKFLRRFSWSRIFWRERLELRLFRLRIERSESGPSCPRLSLMGQCWKSGCWTSTRWRWRSS